MAGYDEVMDGLRARAQQLIGSNALALAPHGVGPQTKAPTPPEKQWWNLPAKYHAAERIKAEMMQFPGHNDEGDALRHAELSRRLASEIDPVTSFMAGAMHELDNSLPRSWAKAIPAFMGPLKQHAMDNWHSQDSREAMMDLRNNAEGRLAGREGRGLDPARLQTRPGVSPPASAAYQAQPRRPR